MEAVRSSLLARTSVVLMALLWHGAKDTSAQERLAAQCGQLPAEIQQFCARIGEAAEVSQARIGLAFTGGNPVPGTAGSLGRRLRLMPRVSVDGRITAVKTDLPPIRTFGSNDEIGAFTPSFNVDAAVGVLNGFSLLPTVGGFAAVDLLASYGVTPLPGDEGFSGDSPVSWAIGARVGILRESFTVPGVSVSGMYRSIGDIRYGEANLSRGDAFFEASDQSVLSLRGTVGKRIVVLGAAAGVGYDRYKSDVAIAVRNPAAAGTPFRLAENGVTSDRTTVFGNLTWSMIILHATGELGWQSGGDAFPSPTGFRSQSEKGTMYGSIALRLSI